MPSHSRIEKRSLRSTHSQVVDLDQYVPAYFTWIANKLSHGASTAYRSVFSVGIETWRLLVTLAIEPQLTAQAISQAIGMDKASVSRTIQKMQKQGYVTVGLDARDGRHRLVAITRRGRELHDAILAVALERERALLSVLTKAEQRQLTSMLRRLHENLSAVESRTADYLVENFPAPRSRGVRKD